MRRFILARVRILMLAMGAVAGALVILSLTVDEGELVVLITTDADERHHETQLWIVDLDGERFLRASRPNARWMTRLLANPQVEIVRDERAKTYLAAPDDSPELRDRVNRAMAEKYGVADRLWSRFSNRGAAIPIRLEPSSRRSLWGDRAGSHP